VQQVKDWIAKFPTVPRNRIIGAGSGWDTNEYKVDAASWENGRLARRGADFSSQGNNDFMVAFANTIKDHKMGSCWWPGLSAIWEDTSAWSILTLNGGTNNTPITDSSQNQSGMDRLWRS
jgi:hypothetical protein